MVEAFNGQDYSRVAAGYHPDAIMIPPERHHIVGAESIGRYWNREWPDNPPPTWEVSDMRFAGTPTAPQISGRTLIVSRDESSAWTADYQFLTIWNLSDHGATVLVDAWWPLEASPN